MNEEKNQLEDIFLKKELTKSGKRQLTKEEKKFTEIGTILAVFVNIAIVQKVCKTLTENKQELKQYYESNSNIKEN